MAASLARDLQAIVGGQVLEDQAARDERSGDFGRMVKRVPQVVVRPVSTDDVAAALRYARESSVPVATRG